jgi:hypothetical protein
MKDMFLYPQGGSMPGKLQGKLPRTVIENNAGEVITTE